MSTPTRERSFLIAAKASADPRTVLRVLRGEKVKGSVAERIQLALRDLGLTESVRIAADSSPPTAA